VSVANTTTPDAAETPLEEDDPWGSISSKKSKKDKKQSKKSKAGDEDAIGYQSTAPMVADDNVDRSVTEDNTPDETRTQDVPAQRSTEAPNKEVDILETGLESTTQTPAIELAQDQEQHVEHVPRNPADSSDPVTVSGEPTASEIPHVDTKNIDEAKANDAKDVDQFADPVTSDRPEQDIDFAATLAAGLADSGFDPNLVVDDPVFHRRASPSSGAAEADPEEIFTTSSKKKKGKGKKTQGAMPDEHTIAEAVVPAPDDFDLALSQGLQDSGFDPSLLAGAGSPAPADIKDDEDEFSFTKSNKKKKKGKKALAEADLTPSSTPEALQEAEQEAAQERSLDHAPAVEDIAVNDLNRSQSPVSVDTVTLDSGKPAPEETVPEELPIPAASEPVEATEDDWAAPSKSKKKSKKDKKKQDRSIDAEDSAAPTIDTIPESIASEIPEAQTQLSSLPDSVPEIVPQVTDATGEEEWGAPSKKKKGKKGKKQQDSDWQDGESMITPLGTPAELGLVDSQSEPSFLTEQPGNTPMEIDPAPAGDVRSVSADQPSQTVDDEWAAPSKKKKGKKGKKQQDTDWQDSTAAETPVDSSVPTFVEATGEPQTAPPLDQLDTLVPDDGPVPTNAAQPADVEQQAVVADDEWGAPSKKKKKGKKDKLHPVFDIQDEQTPESPAMEARSAAVDPTEAVNETTRDVSDSVEPVPDNTLPSIDTTPPTVFSTEEPLPADLGSTVNPDEDEWAALPSNKKNGKKSKKNQALEVMNEQSPAHESTGPTPLDDDIAVRQESMDGSVEPAQDPMEPAEAQSATTLTTGDLPVTEEIADEEWDASTSKKDKKKKKKKGVVWSEPDEVPQDASRALGEDIITAPVETADEFGTIPRHVDENVQPESDVLAEGIPVVPDPVKSAVDEWSASSKKKKGKKSKKNEDAWGEPEILVADVEPTTPETFVTNETPAPQPDDTATSARGVDNLSASLVEDLPVVDHPTELVTEPAEEEWGSSSKKKGKKNKKKLGFNEPEVAITPLDALANPLVLDSTPAVLDELSEEKDVSTGDSSSKIVTIDDSQAPESPAPVDTTVDSWDLPVKKNKKKGKKSQQWIEEEPDAAAPDPLPTFDPPTHTSDMMGQGPVTTGQSQLPGERSLDAPSQQDATPISGAMSEQVTTAANEDEWGVTSKKKGKKNRKKGVVSDADLDPFISTPLDSSAPISTTDTAEVSAVEDSESAAIEAVQPTGEMDIDEMDKAYKAYKKNKRKQKKMQAVSGDENEQPADLLSEVPEQQHHTSRDLSIPEETEPARQPSPLASEEPTWSFAKLQEDQTPDDTGRGLTKMTSRGSLTSRRSLEPLHLDTASSPALDADNIQTQQEPQSQPSGSAHGRTASRDTPLEPTSRDRASYLFQSPAPFQESTSNNATQFRTPEHRGDASDYFHSRGVDPLKDDSAGGPLSPSAGLMSPMNALDPIPEEHAAHKRSIGEATNITPMEPAGKMLRRTETPKAIREQSLLSSASRDVSGSIARSASNPISGFGIADEDRTLKRVVSDTRSPSAMSSRSNFSANQHVSPEDRRTLSRASNRSVTPTLRRTNLSGDLRAASRTSNRRGDSGSAVGARSSPKTIPFEPPPTPPLNDEDEVDPGATRAAGMAETFVSRVCNDNTRADANDTSQQGYGGGQVSQVSPTRPPSMRKRQSMHVMDLETKLEQLTSENRALQEAQQSRGLDDGSMDTDNHGLQQALDARELELREKNNEIQHIQAMLEPMQQEITRLVQINSGLTEANRNMVDDNNGRFATLKSEHANVTQQWQNTTRDLENMRQEHSRLSSGMRDAVAAQLSTALAEKDHEIRKLKDELAEATDRIRALQVQIQSSKSSDFLNVRDEDYFDGACQKLCQHVQQWVLRFSKMSDNRICRLSSDLRDEKIEARLDNALLDGMDVDKLLGDRVRRRDVFMSVVMTMVWEYVFTRYLFGMDREQRQKLKALEKTLSEVGPPRAVAQWRATTLTLLAKRPTFSKQCALDTEAVAHEIFGVLSALLTPPSGSEQQLLSSLTKVITVAVNLSVEMRTQRAEYIMLPPLQPEYDTNGDLVRKVHFNASLMNERSGLFTSNEALEAERAIVKIVLFPLVVKKGDEYGEGEEEIVVCPAQVLVHNDSGKSRKVVRVMSGAMEIDDPRRSKQSLISRQGSMQF